MARGFSLFELIIVLTILGLVLSIGAVSIGRGGEATRTKLAAQDLAAALTATRSAAIAQASSHALHMDLEARSYTGPGSIKGRFADTIAMTMVLADRERTGDHSGAVRFFPDGTATGGRITLGGSAWQRVVTIDWMTGRVRIDTPEESADAPL